MLALSSSFLKIVFEIYLDSRCLILQFFGDLTVLSPKKTPVSHPGQWVYKEKKPSETDLLHQVGPFHENVRKAVSDFCNWATSFVS